MSESTIDFRKFPSGFAEIGVLGHSHALHGEINFVSDNDDCCLSEGDFVFVDIDTTMIPLQIQSIRQRTTTSYLIHFTGYDSDTAVDRFRNLTVYIDADSAEAYAPSSDEAVYLDDVIGYDVVIAGSHYGTVTDTDQSTANALIIVTRPDSRQIMIPFAESYINEVDTEHHQLMIDLPPGYAETF